jgi:hypothetical protein
MKVRALQRGSQAEIIDSLSYQGVGQRNERNSFVSRHWLQSTQSIWVMLLLLLQFLLLLPFHFKLLSIVIISSMGG